MSRILRNQLLYKGCYAHIISRSIRKLKLFYDTEDFLYFKDLLIRAKERAKFDVRIGGLKDFSLALRDVKRDYAYKFHSKYKFSGPIWRERFKSLLIENVEYLYACGNYIEENPVKVKLVKECIDWVYSSSRHYVLNEVDKLVDNYDRDLMKDEALKKGGQKFDSGSIIGSDFFKFQFFENRRRSGPVPLE